MRDAKDDGKKALQILKEHYMSQGKPKVIALYTELTTLEKGREESTMSYSFRWRKRIKTDDHNRLLKTNMAVRYHTSAVIQSPMPWACAGM